MEFQSMIRQMNSQLTEQKKAVAKISKLCLGALTSVEQLETKVNKDGINNETKNQPMERIKKLAEDTAKLNNYMHEIDLHLDGVEKYLKDEMQKCLPLTKMMAKLGKKIYLKIHIFLCSKNLDFFCQ